MLRCKNCLIPRHYSAVSFGDDGICSLCRDHTARSEKEKSEKKVRAKRLEEIVAEVREEDGEYDCIVPVSGGRDSSFVAYTMRRRFGLRVLGVNYDNGYRSPLAVANLERISKALDMNLVTLKPDPSLLQRIFAHFFRTCGYFCLSCDAIGCIVIGSFAAREAWRTGRRPLVVGGWSRKYEYQPGLSVLSMRAFNRILGEDCKLHGAFRENPLVQKGVFDAFVSVDDIRHVMPGSSAAEAVESIAAHAIQLPDYVDWDYQEITDTLKRELGFESPDNSHGAHFDCVLAPVSEYLKNRKYGISQETLRNSVLIREGRITRDEARRRMALEQTTEPPIFRAILADWNVTADEVAWGADWPR